VLNVHRFHSFEPIPPEKAKGGRRWDLTMHNDDGYTLTDSDLEAIAEQAEELGVLLRRMIQAENASLEAVD